MDRRRIPDVHYYYYYYFYFYFYFRCLFKQPIFPEIAVLLGLVPERLQKSLRVLLVRNFLHAGCLSCHRNQQCQSTH